MADTLARALEPLASDPSDVSDALDVALSLWENGKRSDAIQWAKRAAEAARKSDAARMATLARTVEEMERAATTMSRPPPPVIPVPATAVSRPPPPPVPTSMSRPPPPRTSVTPPPPPIVKKAPIPPAPSSDHTLRVRASMRVSVRTSVRDEHLLVVRPLADGAKVPAGAREALLTFVDDTDADDDLLEDAT